MSHSLIVFYDGECALCNRAVRYLLKHKPFQFAPLQGQTAKEKLKAPISLDSLILWEDGKEYRLGKGALRICWHLGGPWKALGLFSFLPTFLADVLYRLVAKNRHLFGKQIEELPPHEGRFLP